jgi:inorganic pyrophosphatase
MGGVYRVKPIGVYAMIDDGELDWKVGAAAVGWRHARMDGSSCTATQL